MTNTTEREQWLAERRTGIGGSDAAAILGLSKWRTPYAVWQDKTGQGAELPDSAPLKWGRNLEPIIRQEYAEATGRTVWQPKEMLRHPQHPFMLANLDGMTEDRRIVEIKTARSDAGWGEPGTDAVPVEYLLQVQHYMLVTGFPVADIAVLFGGQDFRLYEVAADAELHALLVEEETRFWQSVIDNVPPEPVSVADAVAKFGQASNGQAIEASSDVLQAIKELHAARAAVAQAQEQEDAAKTRVMAYMGAFDTLMHEGKPLCTWKAQAAPRRFNSDAFKRDHPELYQQYIQQGEPLRRFLIKQ